MIGDIDTEREKVIFKIIDGETYLMQDPGPHMTIPDSTLDEHVNFILLCEGLRDGRDKDELRPLIEKNQAMLDRAVVVPSPPRTYPCHVVCLPAQHTELTPEILEAARQMRSTLPWGRSSSE